MRYCNIRKNQFNNLITMTLKWYLANERIILNWKDINHMILLHVLSTGSKIKNSWLHDFLNLFATNLA